MNESDLRKFLHYRGVTELLSECKLYIYLYLAFTILFVDIHFLVTLNLSKDNLIWFSIGIFLTLLVIPFVVIYIRIRKMAIYQILFFQGILFVANSLVFFYLLFVKAYTKNFFLDYHQLVTMFIMFVFLVLALIYRRYLLKHNFKQKSKPVMYIGVFNASFGLITILRPFLKGIDKKAKNEILSHALIVLAFLFLILALVMFQNTRIAFKHRDQLTQKTEDDPS